MSAISGTRAFDRNRHPGGPACFAKRSRIGHPVALVEIRREKPAGLVHEQGVDADDMAALQVILNHPVGDREERLVRALPAAHPRLLADTSNPFVAAGGCVASAACFRVGPKLRIDVVAATEEGSKERDLLGRRCWDRRSRFCRGGGNIGPCSVERRQLRLEGLELAFRRCALVFESANRSSPPLYLGAQRLPTLTDVRVQLHLATSGKST